MIHIMKLYQLDIMMKSDRILQKMCDPCIKISRTGTLEVSQLKEDFKRYIRAKRQCFQSDYSQNLLDAVEYDLLCQMSNKALEVISQTSLKVSNGLQRPHR